jgi:hypothetical protein
MYHRFRQKKGKGWTDDAQRLAIRRLEKLRSEGHDPTAVIEAAVLHGWSGLFPLKPDQSAHQSTPGVNKHGNFSQQDYRAGIKEDGRF